MALVQYKYQVPYGRDGAKLAERVSIFALTRRPERYLDLLNSLLD